jgi:flagellar assembly protein FliH
MKRHTASGMPSSVAFNFEDIQSRCDTYKAQISVECRELIQNATKQAEEIRRKAQADGHSEGYRNGLKQAETEIAQRSQQLADELVEQRLSTVLPAVSQLLDEIVTARSQCQAEWERELVDLSTGIAEKLIRRTFEATPEAMIGVVQEAVQLAVGKTSLELRLNPRDLEALGDRVRVAVRESARGIEVKLLGDDKVSPGGCIVMTEHGEIDAQIETLLTRISDELLEGITD